MIGNPEIRMIRKVEKLTTELEIGSLAKLEQADNRGVQIEDPWSPHQPYTLIAELINPGLAEGFRVEPALAMNRENRLIGSPKHH